MVDSFYKLKEDIHTCENKLKLKENENLKLKEAVAELEVKERLSKYMTKN